MAANDPASNNPLSLQRLKDAFARLLTPAGPEPEEPAAAEAAPDAVSLPAIIEGVLFVAGDGGRPRTADELAETLRDVSPEEVDQAIADLNHRYQADAAPYHIQGGPTGYRLRLDEDLARLRDKFHGRVREAKLTPTALEVLSVVAYRQPATAAQIDKLRGSASQSHLRNLVRRGLVRLDEPDAGSPAPSYRTTDRFLKLFNLRGLEQLPRASELE